MSHLRVANEARIDLDEIWIYIGQDDPDAADRLIRAIAARFQMLSSMPKIGRERKELARGLRSFPVGNYIIFYRPMSDGVDIVRVLHGARDFPPIFG